MVLVTGVSVRHRAGKALDRVKRSTLALPVNIRR